ncbi:MULTISPECIES: hypothetical protein [unclassified Cryobacterium]|uniref:hypothetical protein n=1 Tax=unclassified Cryobacterium TaxID=2649013 RepID=UPI00106C93EE|nr:MULTISPECIES: hypothetical protein [unclassified Cryobacterium]TFC59416.1 hypothetical protein E3O68_00510 [Cryobacterium sp. TMB3-1-2]TFC67212.1 hypothetical protein E3T21_17205 [Cryobacterium sp. TMB3-15]TFC73275.1 hypothetical protein E3T22_16850 [Cryobacterium sp. TMB3-10]TFD46163.1 hypothetical protein E3T58_01485 [Cryobacterium sp. TMB3-12]
MIDYLMGVIFVLSSGSATFLIARTSRLRSIAKVERRIQLSQWLGGQEQLESRSPGYLARHPDGPIGRLDGTWQYGHEIEGYGFIMGHCNGHRPHRTKALAAECGRRWLTAEPTMLRDRLPHVFDRLTRR